MNDSMTFTGALMRFLKAPIRLQTYANLLYLALAFPLGLLYFLFLTIGLPLGYFLTILWIGIPILAVVFAGSWWMTALERQLAIRLLKADVPPMAPPPADGGFWQRVKAFFSNPVTWKGMGYLLLKLPLGVMTFIVLTIALPLSAGLMAAPFAWYWGELSIDLVVWYGGTLADAWICAAFGTVLMFLSLNLMNGLAWGWRELAVGMLGSRRFETPAPPPVLAEPAVA